MVKATPRFSTTYQGTALDLTGRLFLLELKSCENEEQFQQKLIKTAQDLGHHSIDEFLKIPVRRRRDKRRARQERRNSQQYSYKRMRSNPPPGQSFFTIPVAQDPARPIKPLTTSVSKPMKLSPPSIKLGSSRMALGITPEESERRWKNKLCSLCGPTSHRASNCTNEK